MFKTATGLPDGHHRLWVQPDFLYEDCLHVFEAIQAEAAQDSPFAQTIYNAAVMAADRRELLEGKSKPILAQLKKAIAVVDAATTPWEWL